MTNKAIEWCDENNIPTNSFNIVTALCSMGYIKNNHLFETEDPGIIAWKMKTYHPTMKMVLINSYGIERYFDV